MDSEIRSANETWLHKHASEPGGPLDARPGGEGELGEGNHLLPLQTYPQTLILLPSISRVNKNKPSQGFCDQMWAFEKPLAPLRR